MTINYKVFAAGDTLSANDVLTYLENQAVIKVDAASELPTLASTYPNVKVAYAADTDKVYVNDDGTYVALVTADGTVTLSNLTLTGNLTVQGTTTTIDSTTVAIKDKFVFEGATPDAFETELVVAEPTADRTVTIPDATTTLVGRDTTDTLTNKTINLSSNTLSGTLAQLNTAVSDADVVSLAGAETLTNKTINLASNTVSTTLAQLNTAITDADVATLAGSETLTNKTISGATNTLTNIGNASLTNSSITMDGTPVSLGGTFTSPASYALPSQTGNSGKFLTTNGTAESWGTVDLTTKTDKSTLTTTGDIYYASSASTPARLGIGTTGQVLTVASGLPSWATPSGGGGGGSLTLLQTLTLSGTNSVTTSTFSSGYTNLLILLVNVHTGSGGNLDGTIRFNGDSSSNYVLGGVNGQDSQAAGEGSAGSGIPVISTSNDSNNNAMQIVNVFRYNDSGRKLITSHGYGGISGGGNSRYRFLMGTYKGGAITNFTFARSQVDHSYNGGNIYIYGVN
jgi:hypothetical protein